MEEFEQKVSQSQKTQNLDNEWDVEQKLQIETKVQRRKFNSAQKQLDKFRAETFRWKISKLKRTPTQDEYGDVFNQMVCMQADSENVNLRDSQVMVEREIKSQLDDDDFIAYLTDTLRYKETKYLQRLVNRATKLFVAPAKILSFSSVLFELAQRQTESTRNGKDFEKKLVNAINGEVLSLISVLCTINEFDYEGGYTLNSDLNTYLNNQKVEPIPLIVRELEAVVEFFKFYDISSQLTIYVADTDYTEIGQYGEVSKENLRNLKIYVENLEQFVRTGVRIVPISIACSASDEYKRVKQDILEKVKFADKSDEERMFRLQNWKKYERSVEGMAEAMRKRNLFTPGEIRFRAKEIIQNIWAVNAAQGAMFSELRQNTIMVSTERWERDQNYTIDKEVKKNLPAIVYILREAEAWNRKLQRKET